MVSQLLFGGQVEVPKPHHHVLNGLDIVYSIYLMEGLAARIQGDCCVDSPEACLDGSGANRPPSFPFPNVPAKHCGDLGDRLEVTAVKVWRHADISAIGRPFFPIFLPILGSCLHSPIDDPASVVLVSLL